MMTGSKLQRKITRQMTISGDSAVSSGNSSSEFEKKVLILFFNEQISSLLKL
jgi:hypothetical protein